MVNPMLVSAVVSTFNAQRFIRGRLQNLVNQTLYQKGLLEIIVIDSGSQEDEESIVREFSSKYRNIFYLRTEQRETVYGAWNRGIAMARGRYFINANTDDRFIDDALEKLSDILEKQPAVDAAYGDWLYTETENDYIDSSSPKKIYEYPDFYPPLLFYHQFTSHALMIRRSIFSEIGLFNNHYEVFGDRDWVFRFTSAGFQAIHIQQLVGLYLKRDDSRERASQDAGAKEFNNLLQYYQQKDHFVILHGYHNQLEKKAIAQLYALTGAIGLKFVVLNDGVDRVPQQSLVFFRRALELDPNNLVAGNNLAVVASTQGGNKYADENFSRLLSMSSGVIRTGVEKNINLNKIGSRKLTEFYWIF